MAVMPKWADYLPDEARAREVVAEAREKARGGTLAFVDAAAEAIRLGVLVNEARVVIDPHLPRLREALASMSSLDGPDAIAGVLALATAALVHGAELDAYDSTREARILGELAIQGVKSRALAYGALAAGRPELAVSFSDDAGIARLGKGDPKAYVHFVGTFPESDASYEELGFVARAYAGLVEKRTGMGVRAASTWLHRTIHAGPQPVDARVLPAPHDPLHIEGRAARDELAAAAEEAIRTLVDVDRTEAMQIFYRSRNALLAKLPGLSAQAGAQAVFGALALINVALIHGGYVAGWYDAGTRSGLEREIAMLTELASLGVKSRPLAFVALGNARPDVAARLSDDPAIAALGAGDAKAYHAFVGAFRESAYTYAELGFVGRAYALLVEKRGTGGIGIGADWLYQTMQHGPQPVNVHVDPKPLPEIPTTWIAASDVHGLWGGRIIDITPNGDVTLVVVPAGPVEWSMTKGRLTPDEIAQLRRVLAQHDPRTMDVPMENGIPGEVNVSVAYVADGAGEKVRVRKWNHQSHGGFDAVVSTLFGFGERVRRSTSPSSS